MSKRLSIVVTAALLTCLTGGFTASPAGASAASLTGAGSTLVAPLEATWAIDFERRYGDSVVYSAVGSGAGISQITARTVDFGASDAPLTPSQFAACKAGSSPAEECIQIPWALSGIGISWNLHGIRSLHLTGPLIAEIYLGKITNWDAPAIKKLNKGVKLPNLKITPVYRSDGSGTTYGFTDYESRVSTAFKDTIGNSTAVSFPTGVGGKGNAGVTAVVQSTEGAIGYVEVSYMIAHGLPAAAVENAAGSSCRRTTRRRNRRKHRQERARKRRNALSIRPRSTRPPTRSRRSPTASCRWERPIRNCSPAGSTTR